jgi:predicted Zn-ribbon and HTH transcriptional regulator
MLGDRDLYRYDPHDKWEDEMRGVKNAERLVKCKACGWHFAPEGDERICPVCKDKGIKEATPCQP